MTNQTIIYNYFGNESYYVLQNRIEQQMELINALRQEKEFLLKQVDKIIQK